MHRQIGMYFDHVLSKEDEKDLLERINHNPDYRQMFAREKANRENLKKQIHRPGVPPDLIQVIKDKIRVI
jgi:hypothetical protein